MKKILLLTVIIILIPLLIVGLNNSEQIINKIRYGSYNNKVIKVKRTASGIIEEVPLEQYVIGVVAGEMPVSFNLEALKAQAVASRTYALKQTESKREYDVEDGTVNQVYLDSAGIKKKWTDNYEQNLSKITNAVESTKGEVVLYNNEIISAMFFSTSNGHTENSGDVFTSDKPYLVSVDSAWDKDESPVFSTTKEVNRTEFLFNLGLETERDVSITDVDKTSTGRVKSLLINGKKFKSSEIRSIFGLRSTSFEIEQKGDKVIFHVNGFGHGVGMSQYGANGMAKSGYSYQEILKHYYKNCEIKKIN